jgi:hypothetical protein
VPSSDSRAAMAWLMRFSSAFRSARIVRVSIYSPITAILTMRYPTGKSTNKSMHLEVLRGCINAANGVAYGHRVPDWKVMLSLWCGIVRSY